VVDVLVSRQGIKRRVMGVLVSRHGDGRKIGGCVSV
jgi:hypothetical protein